MSKLPVYGINEFESLHTSEGFYANNLLKHLETHKFVNAPHSHSTYITVLFTNGSGRHHIDFETYEVRPWTVFLLQPGQVHHWELSDDIEGYVFFHTAQFYNGTYAHDSIEDMPFFFLSQNYPMVDIASDMRSYMELLFYELWQESAKKELHKRLKLSALAALIYVELSRVYKPRDINQKKRNGLRIMQLQKLIDLHYIFKKKPSDYAEFMNMSTRHLSRICKEALNKSTSDLIQDRLVLQAKRLFIHSQATVATVAYSLGFDDASYFARWFKEKTGFSPKEFKQNLSSQKQ